MRELALHVLDVCENALRAGATRIDLTITEDTAADRLTIDIIDNGSGMDAEMSARARDPFFTTKHGRRIGLGLPLLEQAATATGGTVSVTPAPSGGTQVTATFGLAHPDRQPLGDLGGVVAMVLSGTSSLDIRLVYTYNGTVFVFDSGKLRNELDGLWVDHPAVVRFIRDRIRAGLDRRVIANP